MADEAKMEEKKEDVKPSESSKIETGPAEAPAKKEETPPAPPPKAAPATNGDSSNENKKLVEDLAEKLRAREDQLNKTQMELARIHEERARLRRVFKPGFRVAKRQSK